MGLVINEEKTRYMFFSGNKVPDPYLEIDSYKFETVKRPRFLLT